MADKKESVTAKKPTLKTPEGSPKCFGKYPKGKGDVGAKCRACIFHAECKKVK